ncbi:MAG TPA: HAMP domain-containing protein, partial [Hellea balneolensis]|nr:HAMP domain-containing protein [Hellea balneolensis]
LVLVLAIGVYLAVRLKETLFGKQVRQSAPHLHRRFVLIFSLAAIIPAILVGMFFSTLMSQNVNTIFGSNVQKTMETSLKISDAYLRSERQTLGQSVLDIANDLNRNESHLKDRITYTAFLINQAVFREVPVIYVINSEGRILAQAEGPAAPPYVLPPKEAFDGALNGSIAFTTRAKLDYLVALYKLENYDDAYLYTGRYLRTGLLENMEGINNIQNSFATYTLTNNALKRVFLLVYIQMALLIAFAAIWLALLLANRIVAPLGEMVSAAEKVRSGDLSTRVETSGVWDEIHDLANAFNRMTSQLNAQRKELTLEHDISEQRREFSEAVLSGVSAGVIGLSPEGKISVINKSAEDLLGVTESEVIGKPLSSVFFAFQRVYQRAIEDISGSAEDQVNIETTSGTKNLDIRISPYHGEIENTGWVITFDDMTRLVAAQRHSAWREVARRIAHEIKNPLTPIQLSAERLERKYLNEIKSDPDSFKNCTGTIIRQVSNMGRMVDEFSAFARMPAPILQIVDIKRIVEETIFAQHVAFPDVEFSVNAPSDGSFNVLCDERLIGQALTNIYKNAGEAILRRTDQTGNSDFKGMIQTSLSVSNNNLEIEIADNGIGWPETDRDRLLEPYMTTRKSGSGLGLAIVNRIVADHGGELELRNPTDYKTGAIVLIILPVTDFSNAPEIPDSHKITSNEQEKL